MPIPLPPHVQWLLDHRGDALRPILDRQGVRLDTCSVLAVLMSADPSPGHHAVQWLFDALLADGLLWEDVASGRASKAAQTLQWFAQHRTALPRGSRNLESYSTLAALYRAVEPYLETAQGGDDTEADADVLRGREARRAQRAQAYGESIIVCSSPDLVVAVPLSRGAGQWWGRGTRWCTAADKSNMFEEYNREAPLIVVVPRGAHSAMGKLQLYLEPDGGFQFMDAADEHVRPEFVAENWATLGPIMLWALQRSPRMLQHVPLEFLSQEICRSVVQKDACMLTRVPPEYMDEAMCLGVVGAHGTLLQCVPEHLRTLAVCLAAVEQNGNGFDYVPAHLHTPELVLAAVRGQGSLLGKIAPPQRTPELCMAAARSGCSINLIPSHLHNRELLCAAMASEGHNLAYLPVAQQDRELCMLALAHRGVNLGHVRPDLVDRDMVVTAVCNYPGALRHVPTSLVDEDICRMAVERDGSALEWLLPQYRTRELCEIAVRNDGYAIEFVPDLMRDEAMSLLAVAQNPWVLTGSGPLKVTPDVIAAAIIDNPHICGDIDCLDYRIVVSCVAKNGDLLQYLPSNLYTVELCVQAIANTPDAMDYIPTGLVEAVRAALPPQDPTLGIALRDWEPGTALAGLAECLQAVSALDHQAGPEDNLSLVLPSGL